MVLLVAGLGGCGGGSSPGVQVPPPPAPPLNNLAMDLRTLAGTSGFARWSGSASTGRFGVPVAAGFDIDGDGFSDVGMSNMQAAPFGRAGAGQVLVLFGDGSFNRSLDSAVAHPDVLVIAGAARGEAAGGEIWFDDVTGDGVGDVLVGRHNAREPLSSRVGAGALSIIAGGATLRDLARNQTVLDLAAPPPGVNVVTLYGRSALDRLGFWLRTGDATGDGIADILVGADQQDGGGESNRGAAYLVRGGAHLNARFSADLADFGATTLSGHLARFEPPAGADNYHFGATVALADLDNNGVCEVLISAALSRVGGLLVADGAPADSAVRVGGNPGGSLFIFWDDNVGTAAQWPAGLTISAAAPPGAFSRIDGGAVAGVFTNDRFGEELLGGLDYDADGAADLFVGDITGTPRALVRGGVGHVFFPASALRGRSFNMGLVPAGVRVTTLLGPAAGAISSDTSMHGDLDGDGVDDLVVSSPLAAPLGRVDAGTVHVLWGQARAWPAIVDFAAGARPAVAALAITDLHGANGARSADDTGDTLMYSAAAGDIDGDGRTDLVINEMRGNGIAAGALDVGNLLMISGQRVLKPAQ